MRQPGPRAGRERKELGIVTLSSASRRSGHPFEIPEGYAGYRVLDPEGREVSAPSRTSSGARTTAWIAWR
jgi:hypothetical protein